MINREENWEQSSASRLRSVLNALSDPVLTTNPDHSIRRVNRSFSAAFGYEPSELIGQKLSRLLPDGGASPSFINTAIYRDDLPALVGAAHEIRLKAKSGRLNLYELKIDPIDDPDLPGHVIVMRDLSLREQSRLLSKERDKLAASEERFRDFAECGADWLWEIDAEYRFTYMSPQVEDATGYTPEWHLGHTREELGLDTENAELMQELYQEVEDQNDFQERIQVRRRKDGGLVWIAFSGKPILDRNGQFAGYRGVSRDVTAAVMRENDLRATNAELENFAYAASHDLQEPLRKIIAFGERLAEELGDDLEAMPAMYLSRMSAASGRMRTLINNLLDFSRAGHPQDPAEPVNLHETMAQVLADQDEAISATGASIEFSSLPTVIGHESQFYQLLGNLLGNALKFRRPDVRVQIVVSTRVTEAWLVIEFSDNGIGFEDSQADRIFELFGRLHGRSKFEGTGLGLAICRKIVEFHKGRLEARGVPGAGATFTVRLPRDMVLSLEYEDERVA